MPRTWISLTAYRLISRHIDWMFRIRFVWLRGPELTAFLTGLPRTGVLITIVGITQTKGLVLHLTAPADNSPASLLRIPRESCHRFHGKAATDSMPSLPPIPRQSCR